MNGLPTGPVQDYIRLAGICAIYVARFSSGACQVGVTRDLKRTRTMLRRQGQDLSYVAVFWMDDNKLATKIAAKVNNAGCGACPTEAEATARIAVAAAEMKIHLTDHAAVMQRVQSAVSHVMDTLALRAARGLAWILCPRVTHQVLLQLLGSER